MSGIIGTAVSAGWSAMVKASLLAGASVVGVGAGPWIPGSWVGEGVRPGLQGWSDHDGDGREDLLLVARDGGVRLMRNLGDEGFEDVTARVGLAGVGGRGVAWIDVDADGLEDVYVLEPGGTGRLLRNHGVGGFHPVEDPVLAAAVIESAVWLDVDGDGRPDLVTSGSAGVRLLRNRPQGGFEDVPVTLGPGGELIGVTGPVSVPSRVEGEPAVPDAATGPAASRERSAGGTHRSPLPSAEASSEAPRAAVTTVAGGNVLEATSAAGSKVCTPGIADAAGSVACLRASSVPALGKLYPLTPDWFVDASTGNVGLGTTTPAGILHAVKSTNPNLTFEHTGDASTYRRITMNLRHANDVGAKIEARREAGDPDGMSLSFHTEPVGGTVSERLRITPDGEVGIGTSTPDGVLHAAWSTNPAITFENTGDTSAFRRVSLNLRHANDVGAKIEARREAGDSDGMSLTFHTESVGGSVTERLRITPDGELGLGGFTSTDPPFADLHLRPNTLSTFDSSVLTDEDLVIEDQNEAWLGLYSSEEGNVGSGLVLGQRYGGGPGLLHNKWAIYRRTTSAGNNLVFKFTTSTTHPTSGDAALELTADNRAKVRVLDILGADVAERFPVSEEVQPGCVLEIDPEHAGQLRLCRTAVSRRVAGVVSGAGDLPAGAVLGNLPGHEDAPPVALSGRVWVRCDATVHAIEPGDALTTSELPGHAMKVTDHARAQGAMIGKAMTALEEGTGLVLVLVNLQ